MTLEEVIAAFEAGFVVSDERGYEVKSRPGVRQFDRAPNGERYVLLTSAGVRKTEDALEAMFRGEEAAARAWLLEAWKYAEVQGGDLLFWDVRPVFEEAEFVALEQASLINSAVLNTSLAVRLGVVQARLAVSRSSTKKEGNEQT